MTTPAPTITDDHTEFALALSRMAAESPDADSWMAAYVAVRAAGGDHEEAVEIAADVANGDDPEYATDDDIDADEYEEIADDEWDDATEFAKRAEIGERRTRKDGTVWEKKTEKSWVKVQSKDGSDYTRQRSRAAKVGTEVTRKDGSVWTKVGKSKWKRTKTAAEAAADSEPQEPVAADEPAVPEQEPEAPKVDDAPVADEAADPEADKPVRPLTGKEMAGMKLAELRAHAEKIGATPPRDARSKKAWANSIDMRQRLLAQQAEGGPQQEKKREPSKPKRDSGSPSGDSASITPPGRVAMTIPAKDMEAAIPRDGWGDIASIRGKLREMGHNLGPGQLQDFLTEAQRQGVLQLGRWPEALREIPHPNHAMMTPDGSVVYYAKLTGNLGDVKIGATPSAEDVDSVLTDRLQPIPVVYEKLKQKGVDIGIGAFKDRIYSMNRNSHTDPKHSVNIGAWSEALRNLPDPETAMLGMNSIVIHFVGRGPRNSQ